LVILIAVPLSCWPCLLLVIPRRPRHGDEVAQLIYRRLIARHHLLILIASGITLTTVGVAVLPHFAQAITA
jgi:hypothetical protein